MKALEETSVAHAWLALLRVPNLFTVPGDVVAGFLLARPFAGAAEWSSLALLVAASLCLYSAGLILNDWWDVEEDKAERPGRPLASGQIAPSTALAVSIILILLALGLAAVVGTGALVVAATLAALVLFYNGVARRVPMLAPVLAPVTMGLCRGANLLLGASLIFPGIPVAAMTAAGILTLYIIALTVAASRETEGSPRGIYRWAPAVVTAAGLSLFVFRAGVTWEAVVGGTVAAGAVLWVVAGMRADLSTNEAPRKIGSLVRCLIPIQAAFILIGVPGALATAAGVYALWPASRLAGRWFRGS
jgi:4-hydroxybenzoate polyprenyltransferase